MKKLFLSAIAIALAATAYAIPNTFSDGDIVSAEKMNQNFQSLVNGTQTRSTTVDCGTDGTGNGINQAILEGFNNITIKGICLENLNFGTATNDTSSSGNPAPKYIRLVGFDANSKILDASNYEQSVVRIDAGTLVIENLVVEGGIYTISGNRNANVLLSGVTVQNFKERGVSINDSSYLGVDEGGLTITTYQTAPADTDQFGIRYVTGSSGWLHTVEISNVRDGIAVYGGSMTYAYSFNIHDVETAIRVSASSFLKYGEGNSVIENISDTAIRVYTGTFTNWDGSLQISGLSNRALEADRATLEIEDLSVTGNPDTGEDLIAIHNSKFRIVNLDLSDSGRNGLRIQGSEGQIRNAIVANSKEHGLRLRAASVNLDGIITIDSSGRDGMSIEHGSAVSGGWWDLEDPGKPEYTIQILNSGESGVNINNTSSMNFENLLIQNSGGIGIEAHQQSSVNLGRMTAIIGNQNDGIHANASSLNQWGDDEDYLLVKDNWGRGIGLWSGGEGGFNNVHVENNGHGGDASNPDLNKEQGIHVNWNATITLQGGHVTNSGRDGLGLYGSSVAWIRNNFRIADNNQQGISVSGSDLQIEGAIIENNAEIGISGGHNSKLDLRNTTIRGNSGDGVNVSTKSIIDLSSVEVSSNSGCGIALYRDVYIDVDGQLTISGNTNGSLCMGNDTTLAGNPANLSIDSEISCWSFMWKDPNDPTNPDKNQYAASPTLDLWDSNGASLPPISSNCRVNANFQ